MSWMVIPLIVIVSLLILIVLSVKKYRSGSHSSGYEQNLKEEIPFDPELQYAVIRSSICTGEKLAGFKNKKDGHFTEVMLIRSPEDEMRFKRIYGLDEVKIEY